ncbi:hypothetical protein, partial [Clavibacter michiganensis]|uniref:hypothetical protein n=1 Tax=Clavibacter michiganensis TaxID=28447 RepID=UPI0019D3B657
MALSRGLRVLDVPPQAQDVSKKVTSPGGMYSSPAHHVEWTDYPPYNQRNDELIKAVAVQATALDQ